MKQRKKRIPTIRDVAEAAGVSTSTVSYVMNDRNRVGPDTRKKVLRAIEQLGYQPNSSARGLASRHVGSIGLVIPHAPDDVFSDPFFPELLRGIGRSADNHQYTLILSMVKRADLYDTGVHLLRSQRADGLLIIDPGAGVDRILKLVGEGFPLVVIGRQSHPGIVYVDVDNEQGGYTAARHLLSDGKPVSVGVISGPKNHPAARDRLAGYRKGMTESGLRWDEVTVTYGDFTEQSGYICMKRLLEKASPMRVVVANDLMAIGAYKAVKEAGLGIPDDVAMVGFDGIAFGDYLSPPLTTVRQPTVQLGQVAADCLAMLLKGEKPKSQILPVELVIRQSCGLVHR